MAGEEQAQEKGGDRHAGGQDHQGSLQLPQGGGDGRPGNLGLHDPHRSARGVAQRKDGQIEPRGVQTRLHRPLVHEGAGPQIDLGVPFPGQGRLPLQDPHREPDALGHPPLELPIQEKGGEHLRAGDGGHRGDGPEKQGPSREAPKGEAPFRGRGVRGNPLPGKRRAAAGEKPLPRHHGAAAQAARALELLQEPGEGGLGPPPSAAGRGWGALPEDARRSAPPHRPGRCPSGRRFPRAAPCPAPARPPGAPSCPRRRAPQGPRPAGPGRHWLRPGPFPGSTGTLATSRSRAAPPPRTGRRGREGVSPGTPGSQHTSIAVFMGEISAPCAPASPPRSPSREGLPAPPG